MSATNVAPNFLLAPFLFMLPPWVLSTRQWKERKVGRGPNRSSHGRRIAWHFRERVPRSKSSRPMLVTHKTRSACRLSAKCSLHLTQLRQRDKTRFRTASVGHGLMPDIRQRDIAAPTSGRGRRTTEVGRPESIVVGLGAVCSTHTTQWPGNRNRGHSGLAVCENQRTTSRCNR